LGGLVGAVLAVSSVVFSVLYVMSVRPAHRERRVGERAYEQCGRLRMWSMIVMALAMVCFVLYRWFPPPIDPLPAVLPWPYPLSVAAALLVGVPAMALIVLGMRDAGAEAIAPDKASEMYGGIYEHIRHPQIVGEAPIWLVLALLLNSPSLALLSLVYLVVWTWWAVEEERDLLLRFGQAYADYRERTGMFVPKRCA